MTGAIGYFDCVVVIKRTVRHRAVEGTVGSTGGHAVA